MSQLREARVEFPGKALHGKSRQEWRLLVLVTSLSIDGGAEVQAVCLAVELRRRGWDVTVATLRPAKAIPAALAEAGIPVLSAGVRGALSVPAALLRLRRILRQLSPSVVHAHMTHAVLVSRALRVLSPMPVLIGTLHGLRMYNVAGGGFWLRELLCRASNRLADLTTVVCRTAQSYYAGAKVIPPRRMAVVANGVDTDRFQPDQRARNMGRQELGVSGEFVWLSTGRLDPIKDHHTLLRSFAKILKRNPRSVLLLAGSGNSEGCIRELTHELGLDANVRFLGIRKDMPQLMNAADGLVLSSRFEALPMVLLEAGACGLPVVATDVGGNSEIIDDGLTGYLSPVGDVESLAGAMDRLALLTAAEREALGRSARRKVVAEYGLGAVVDRWEEIYRSLLAGRGVAQ